MRQAFPLTLMLLSSCHNAHPTDRLDAALFHCMVEQQRFVLVDSAYHACIRPTFGHVFRIIGDPPMIVQED